MVRSIFRNLENKCPSEAYTGDPELDKFIESFDEKLLGRKKLRLPVLLELKDHLMESKKRSSAKSAVEKFGDGDEWIAMHNGRLWKIFFGQVALFFPFMFVSFWLFDKYAFVSPTDYVGNVINSAFTSLVISFLDAFITGGGRKTTEASESQETYELYDPDQKKVSNTLSRVFLVISVVFIFVKSGQAYFAGKTSPVETSIWLTCLSIVYLPHIGAMLVNMKITVMPGKISVKRLFGKIEIKAEDILGMESKASFPWFADIFGKTYRLVYKIEGSTKKIRIPEFFVNFDRLRARLDKIS